MTIQDYEAQNGFRDELNALRQIGMLIVTLNEAVPCRPHRDPELKALDALQNAANKLRDEICETRNLGQEDGI